MKPLFVDIVVKLYINEEEVLPEQIKVLIAAQICHFRRRKKITRYLIVLNTRHFDFLFDNHDVLLYYGSNSSKTIGALFHEARNVRLRQAPHPRHLLVHYFRGR